MYSGLISFSESAIVKRGTTDVPARPYLRSKRGKDKVILAFDMDLHASILIYCKRGKETDFTLLAEVAQGPYIDTRPNLTAYAETREYMALFSIDGEPVGEPDHIQVKTKGRFKFF